MIEQDVWLIGSNGVWAGHPGGDWQSMGRPYAVEDIDRSEDDLLIATGHGLWRVHGDRQWTQCHDETLTEVLSIERDARGQPIASGSYGVSLSRQDANGVSRWRSLTEDRIPDQRYTNVLRLASDDEWLAGTEAGVLRTDDGGANWQMTDLTGTAVRCLEPSADGWWAGSDDRGLHRSEDGFSWTQVDCPSSSVYSVATDGDRLLVGGFDGVHCRHASDTWQRMGPRALVRDLVVFQDVWAAAADPGGLWVSRDAGDSWRRQGHFQRVTVIDGPRVGGER